MKVLKFIICTGLFCIGFLLSVTAQAVRKTNNDKSWQTMLDEGRYKINIDRALPMGGKSVYLTSDYSIEVKNDSLFSYLPYFGRAYNLPYGGGKGLIFNERLVSYKKEKGKKGKIKISFTTKNEEDTYTYRLTIFDNGKTLLQVNSVNRHPISFEGWIEKD